MAVRRHGTLTAASVATVTLDGGYEFLEILDHGTDPIYWTQDGTTPTVQGNDTFVCAAGGWVTERVTDRVGTVDVKLISAGAAPYSVRVLDLESEGS